MFDVYFLKDEDYDDGTKPLPDPLGKGAVPAQPLGWFALPPQL